MQMSRKLIEYARYFNNHPEELELMKKYALIESLKKYGVHINPNSDLDSNCIRSIYRIVIERVIDKYGK